jgi:hypothetical protein
MRKAQTFVFVSQAVQEGGEDRRRDYRCGLGVQSRTKIPIVGFPQNSSSVDVLKKSADQLWALYDEFGKDETEIKHGTC